MELTVIDKHASLPPLKSCNIVVCLAASRHFYPSLIFAAGKAVSKHMDQQLGPLHHSNLQQIEFYKIDPKLVKILSPKVKKL